MFTSTLAKKITEWLKFDWTKILSFWKDNIPKFFIAIRFSVRLKNSYLWLDNEIDRKIDVTAILFLFGSE